MCHLITFSNSDKKKSKKNAALQKLLKDLYKLQIIKQKTDSDLKLKYSTG